MTLWLWMFLGLANDPASKKPVPETPLEEVAVFDPDIVEFGDFQSVFRKPLFPPNLLHLKLGVESPYIQFDIDNLDLIPIQFKPNYTPKLGAGFDYGFFGAYFSFSKLKSNLDEQVYGKSSSTDVQFHFYFERIFWDIYYQRYQGYYTGEVGAPYLVPDLATAYYGLNVFYVLNPSVYQPGSAFTNTILQRRDGGSWYLGASYADQSIHSPASFVPPDDTDRFPILSKLHSVNFRSLPVGGGYGHTWVWQKGFFVSTQVFLALGPQIEQVLLQGDGLTNEISVAAKAQIRLALGQNGKTFFAGIQAMGDSTSYQFGDETLNISSLYSQIYAGARF